mgnify:FL=1
MRPSLLASFESTLAYIANPLGIVSLLILIIGGYHLFRWAYDEILFRGYVMGIHEPPLHSVDDLGQHSLSDFDDFGPDPLSDFSDFGPDPLFDLGDFREIGRALALGWIDGHREFVEELTTVDLDEFEEGDDDDRFDDDFANEYR